MGFSATGALGGGASGAATGGALGGPWGAGIGAIGGALLGGFMGGPAKTPTNPFDKMNAQLAREDYMRYVDTYQPIEDYMFQSLGNWDERTALAQTEAMQLSNRAMGQGQEAFNRQQNSYGIQQTPAQKQALRRQYDIAAATSAVNAANVTGQQRTDQKYALMSGYSPYKVGAN